MKNGILASILTVFLVSCGKQTAPPIVTGSEIEDPAVKNTSSRLDLPGNATPEIPPVEKSSREPTPIKVAEAEEEQASTAPVSGSKSHASEKIAEPDLPLKTRATVNREKTPPPEQTLVTEIPGTELAVEPNPLFPETAWDRYMILPGDYLIKIAKKEYDDFSMWRKIYEWNRAEIGENPNLIYPYHFLKLLKDRLLVKESTPQYFTYSIQPGDNLWNIAKKQYGDPKAWIILLKDNQDLLQKSNGLLKPGSTLRLREQLDPRA